MILTECCNKHIKCRGCLFRLKECKKHKYETTKQFAQRMIKLIEIYYEE